MGSTLRWSSVEYNSGSHGKNKEKLVGDLRGGLGDGCGPARQSGCSGDGNEDGNDTAHMDEPHHDEDESVNLLSCFCQVLQICQQLQLQTSLWWSFQLQQLHLQRKR
ncbi:hypothetical protein GBAR_LOCUS24344, partial [Geodia barretti]